MIPHREIVPVDQWLVEYERRVQALLDENTRLRALLGEAVALIQDDATSARGRAFLSKLEIGGVL
jgi:hypothetical protein